MRIGSGKVGKQDMCRLEQVLLQIIPTCNVDPLLVNSLC